MGIKQQVIKQLLGQRKSKKKQKTHLETKKKKYSKPKSMGYCKTVCRCEVHSNSGLPQWEKSLIKKPNLTPKGLEKEKQMKPKFSRRKKIIKLRAEISEIKKQKNRRENG